MERDTEKQPMNLCGSSREGVVSTIRNKARKLREHSVQLDRLADELSRFSFSQDADEALWKELVSKQF